jgi:hypothetical protein
MTASGILANHSYQRQEDGKGLSSANEISVSIWSNSVNLKMETVVWNYSFNKLQDTFS